MILETKTRIVCDGCGVCVEGKAAHLATLKGESYWDAADKAKAAGWLTVNRPYRRDVHYCQACADTPQKPIANPERKKKCQDCRDRTRAEKSKASGYVCGKSRCVACGWWRNVWKEELHR